jgi:hypothetical protein
MVRAHPTPQWSEFSFSRNTIVKVWDLMTLAMLFYLAVRRLDSVQARRLL